MHLQKVISRSRSSSLLQTKPKTPHSQHQHSLTPSSIPITRPKSLHDPSLSSTSPKILASFSNNKLIKSKYIPSYTRTQCKSARLICKKESITPNKSSSRDPARIILPTKQNSPSQATLRKNILLKTSKTSVKPQSMLLNPISAFVSRTRIGSSRGKIKLNNQDDFFIIENFANTHNQTLISVFDGHGFLGHEVSSYLKRQLPSLIEKFLPGFPPNHPSDFVLHDVKSAFTSAFTAVQASLSTNSIIDVTYSGTTAISVLIREDAVICANVGDSRAIIGRCHGAWEAIELSRDHKPYEVHERQRIENCGGRVERFKEGNGYVGPYRVWLKDQQLPGLAMSRSIGDLIAASVGVSAEPELLIHKLTEADKFIIAATDGIWEFLNSCNCVKIVAEHYERNNIEAAADALMQVAVDLWGTQEMTVDDITFVIVFLKDKKITS